jgi:hypothetical protein
MINQKFKTIAAAASLLVALPWAAVGQEPASSNLNSPEALAERSLTFDVGGGIEYDSNVNLLELDTTTNVGDMIATLEFGLGYDLASTGKFGFSTGYNFSETAHEDFDAFDLRLHRASGTLSWDFGRVDIGTNLQFAEAELDGSDFMTLTQISPYVTKLAGTKLFLRFAYTDTDKDYANNPLRAATADAWSSDIYVFLNGLNTYLLFGLRRDDEDAIDPQFDYQGDRFRVQLTHRFPLGERELTFRTGLRSETRDYTNVTPSIGVPRNDDRVQFEASAELPLGERLIATFDYQRADNQSNLAAVDFDEDKVSMSLNATF